MMSFNLPFSSTHHIIFSSLWSWRGPERVKTFLWKVPQKGLLTTIFRVKRHLRMDPSYNICLNGEEDALHAIRDYALANIV